VIRCTVVYLVLGTCLCNCISTFLMWCIVPWLDLQYASVYLTFVFTLMPWICFWLNRSVLLISSNLFSVRSSCSRWRRSSCIVINNNILTVIQQIAPPNSSQISMTNSTAAYIKLIVGVWERVRILTFCPL